MKKYRLYHSECEKAGKPIYFAPTKLCQNICGNKELVRFKDENHNKYTKETPVNTFVSYFTENFYRIETYHFALICDY